MSKKIAVLKVRDDMTKEDLKEILFDPATSALEGAVEIVLIKRVKAKVDHYRDMTKETLHIEAIDALIPEAERLAHKYCPDRMYWGHWFIGAMNKLTSEAGLRVLGKHDFFLNVLTPDKACLTLYKGD